MTKEERESKDARRAVLVSLIILSATAMRVLNISLFS
jgi:hypothetical protein